MRKLRRKAGQLAAVYQEMSVTFSEYQNSLALACPTECGACCLAPTIEASPLEMLPTAIALFDQGRALQILEDIESAPGPQCIFYKKSSFDGSLGRCTSYETRPSLCRIFGVAARKDKVGNLELSICRVLKSEHRERYLNLSEEEIKRAPLMSEWKYRIGALEEGLSAKDRPINEALMIALQKVLLTSQYSPDDSPETFEPSTSQAI